MILHKMIDLQKRKASDLATLYVKIDDIGSLKITHEASSSRVSREGFSTTVCELLSSAIVPDQRFLFSSYAFRFPSFHAAII
jgi:hypothetical protein